ncbi:MULTISPECIES: hypothetical protein [Tenebrionibacter/Tenebrionicola group]|jgi:hypothetical protein|uniref:Uncharacterized protein n=2 Tax=Tenebrionibacter/Tenebrionicola group TaxID=2969848 RepID=A0A8K0V4N1_9ENTR|nr:MULTISPECIES: hypothetical protein [Tenebrionibacter/Tenebrionicola group]MBK4715070.1 hypothetical protein [Tenebrionibacter intestinalis]MBV5096271.1 hypothetical protein [Tenebrionicola larvae]
MFEKISQKYEALFVLGLAGVFASPAGFCTDVCIASDRVGWHTGGSSGEIEIPNGDHRYRITPSGMVVVENNDGSALGQMQAMRYAEKTMNVDTDSGQGMVLEKGIAYMDCLRYTVDQGLIHMTSGSLAQTDPANKLGYQALPVVEGASEVVTELSNRNGSLGPQDAWHSRGELTFRATIPANTVVEMIQAGVGAGSMYSVVYKPVIATKAASKTVEIGEVQGGGKSRMVKPAWTGTTSGSGGLAYICRLQSQPRQGQDDAP